jgi:hypothetical protein
MPGRLQITIDLSTFSEFMKFTVNLLQIPVLMNNFLIQDISKVNFFVEKLLKINLKHLIKTIKNQYKILKIQCIVLIF